MNINAIQRIVYSRFETYAVRMVIGKKIIEVKEFSLFHGGYPTQYLNY
jgi:hypothetical protein